MSKQKQLKMFMPRKASNSGAERASKNAGLTKLQKEVILGSSDVPNCDTDYRNTHFLQ